MTQTLDALPFSRKDLENRILSTTLVGDKKQAWKDALMTLEPSEIVMMCDHLSDKGENVYNKDGPFYWAFASCKGWMPVACVENIIAHVKKQDLKTVAANMIDVMTNQQVRSYMEIVTDNIDDARALVSELLNQKRENVPSSNVQLNQIADREYYEKYTAEYKRLYLRLLQINSTLSKRMIRLSGEEMRKLDHALHSSSLGRLANIDKEEQQAKAVVAIDQFLKTESPDDAKKLVSIVEGE